MSGTPSSIETSFRNQFREGFEQAYQQSESVFDPLVMSTTQQSEHQSFDRIGEADAMIEDVTRYGDNPTSEIEHDRRRISMRTFEQGKYIDKKDLMRVISDPQNDYVQALLKSGKRKREDFIIEKYFGASYRGKEGGTSVSYVEDPNTENSTTIKVGALNAGSSNPITTGGRYTLGGSETEGVSVGANYDGSGGTASGLTLPKLKGFKTALMRLEAIDQDDIITAVLTSSQFEDLLDIDEIINSDYAVRKSLAEGLPTVWGGYRFIHSERLPVSTGGGADERRCMFFLPKAFMLTKGEELKGDIWMDPSKKNIPYIHFGQTIGGSRMWGEVAGEIRCLES